MSAARMRDQRAKEVEWERQMSRRRISAPKSIYDRENKHHPLNYELQSETNTTGRSEAVYENERTKINATREKYR